MTDQILTLAFFLFVLIVGSAVCWIRIARIEWEKLNHKPSAKEKYSETFKGML